MPELTLAQALETAVAHHQAGRLAEAERIYRQILDLVPDHADALHLLGLVAVQVGHTAAAIDLIGRALAVEPEAGVYHSSLGEAYRRAGQPEQAIACFHRAIAIQPDHAEAHNNLGNTLWGLDRLDEAIAACRRAIELKPDLAEAHNNLGNALQDAGRLDEAIDALDRAIALRPGYAAAHSNRGSLLSDLGRLDEAIDAYHRALQLQPDLAEAYLNLGNARKDQRRLDEAIDAYRQAIALRPRFAAAYNNLGTASLAQGDHEEAIQAYSQLRTLRPGDAAPHSNLLLCSQYRTGVNLAELARTHAEWDECHGASLRTDGKPWKLDRNPERPLRLGFVSPDLHRHPVGYFLVRVLENLDRRLFQAVCYQSRAGRDDLSDRLEAAASEWHDVASLDDGALADQIHSDRIDILFDLSGHAAYHRLLVFARRPAPIQVTWLGYVGTTGLSVMDYLIADRFHVPPGAEVHYRERVLRMPDGYVCFDPPSEAPPVGPLPALERGYVTFGSFNNLAKITPEVIALWAEIVSRLPGSRLLLAAPALDSARVQRRLSAAFAAAGADAAHVEFLGMMPRRDLLAAYNTIDLALDPFPYSGGITSCEALWMGVPVVTYPGETFAGRHSLSHLANVGLTETVATDARDYVERALRIAQDLPRLAGLRAGLRDRMARSPLCDGKRFARHFMTLLRDVWRQWCQT
jgi:predicted O-linked N-acetylglucosamine transferase (SPINDLY family)